VSAVDEFFRTSHYGVKAKQRLESKPPVKYKE
jgi:hypothetical protein